MKKSALFYKNEKYCKTKITTAVSLALSAASVFSLPALADEDMAQAQQESGIEKIIVTSERRSENIQDMGTAIATISGEELLENGMNNLVDAITSMPAVEQQQSNSNGVFYVRGVGSRFPGVDTSVATYSDGVFQSRGEVTNFSFVDVDRIEVLRGPQGTLYGRNSIGGAVNIITKNPDLDENGGSINVQAGNYDAHHIEGVANVVLGENTAVRAVMIKDAHDGYLGNGLSDADTLAARVKLLTKPTENVSVLVGVEYFENGGKGVGNGPITAGFEGLPFSENGGNVLGCGTAPFSTGDPCVPFNDVENLNVFAEIDVELDFATLSFLPSYQDFSSENNQIFGAFFEKANTPFEQKSMEVRLVSNHEGPLEWVAGLYWYDADSSGKIVKNPLFGDSEVELSTNTSQAIYGQATYSLDDDLRIIAGLRHTTDEFETATTVNFTGSEVSLVGGEEYSKVTWKLGGEYDVAENSLLYLSASNGFKQGGVSVGGQTGNVHTWDPEEILAYEFGSKNRSDDGNLQLNLTAFYYIWENYVGNAPTFTEFNGEVVVELLTVNLPGETKIYGLELEGVALAGEDGRFDFSATLNKSAFADTVFNGENLDGRTINHAPEFTASIAYSHTWDISNTGTITANINAKYNDGYWLDLQRSNTEQPWDTAKQESYTLVNASLRYEPLDYDWWVTIYGRNLTEEVVHNQASPGGPPGSGAPLVGVVGNPRTFGVSATYEF